MFYTYIFYNTYIYIYTVSSLTRTVRPPAQRFKSTVGVQYKLLYAHGRVKIRPTPQTRQFITRTKNRRHLPAIKTMFFFCPYNRNNFRNNKDISKDPSLRYVGGWYPRVHDSRRLFLTLSREQRMQYV